ncbi:phage tail protein [Bacillus sp. AFS076308]|uniref:phage tail protein n=1 Tax=Bacillus sp. AFS076308 TaxID=2033512 RepID=UPI00159656C8|nr:phage tail protein [Bacillus sp. AFS076308]
MIVTSLGGQSEFLTDYQITERKRVVNGEYSLPFILFKTTRNSHSFDLVQEESIVEYDGQKYRIKKLREYTKGKTPVKEATTQHIIFDIIDDYQYDTISGTTNIMQALNHVFGVTDGLG